jgi:cobalt/nickel transport system permease protein
MHMADALVSPAVGGTMWAAAGASIAFCARKVKQSRRDDLVPLMGVMGAFVFAAQMINFSIPGTGSSGHLGGGLLLALLLGPYAALLVIASVLTVQAFFFADGGLLALGCNIVNLGCIPAFIAYPLVYRGLAGNAYSTSRARAATIVAAIVGLQLGAFAVVLETRASGISELPFGAFVLLMQPIHLAISVVEGLATVAALSFIARARPEALRAPSQVGTSVRLRSVLVGVAVSAAILGGVASWFASTHPDGLEWSIAGVSGREELLSSRDGLRGKLAALQEATAFLPGYGFRTTGHPAAPAESDRPTAQPWPAVSAETSLSGFVGGSLTLALACLLGLGLRAGARRGAGRTGRG